MLISIKLIVFVIFIAILNVITNIKLCKINYMLVVIIITTIRFGHVTG